MQNRRESFEHFFTLSSVEYAFRSIMNLWQHVHIKKCLVILSFSLLCLITFSWKRDHSFTKVLSLPNHFSDYVLIFRPFFREKIIGNSHSMNLHTCKRRIGKLMRTNKPRSLQRIKLMLFFTKSSEVIILFNPRLELFLILYQILSETRQWVKAKLFDIYLRTW